ncbi:glycosyltransferase family 2 protein [Bacillus sp. DNRA2]|uniref:glycosyltransferase family 2 protein n=1 Tax=Bacillus sp. DNRA2 TaxID=2723053 RepID=UPI00145C5EBB|nr:glycosyltransferase family 2 protein [Bacillus sp. DNRA2]NMD70863.1 glycosyltransferase family 2 protein [Bacillus sp. DNRA2]
MELPLLSIIIPVYNAEKTIGRAILSVIEQTEVDFELLLVNDGSTDNSLAVMTQFAEMNPRIKLFSRPNEGVSGARNFGIEQAKGKFISFLDADDYYAENGLGSFMKELDDHTQLVIYGYDIVYDTKTIECSPPVKPSLSFTEKESFRDYCLLLIEDEIINAPWNKVYLKSYLLEHQILFPADLDMGEDLKFNLDVLKDVQYVKVIPKPLVNYTVKKGAGLVSKFRANRLELRYMLMMELKKLIFTWGKLDKTEALIDRMLMRDIMAFFMDFYKQNCPYKSAERREIAGVILKQEEIREIIMRHQPDDFITKLLKIILITYNSRLILLSAKILNIGRGFR